MHISFDTSGTDRLAYFGKYYVFILELSVSQLGVVILLHFSKH
jgi:hypothetical protein